MTPNQSAMRLTREQIEDWRNGLSRQGRPTWQVEIGQQICDMALAALDATQEERDGWRPNPEWSGCKNRGSFLRNSFKSRIAELRKAEKRAKNAYKTPFMGDVCRYFGEACGKAADVFQGAMDAIPPPPVQPGPQLWEGE